MVFVTTPKQMSMYGNGRYLSKDRYKISKGLKVYYDDDDSVSKEFTEVGLIKCADIEEPIKYMEGEEPISLKFIECKKK